MKTENLVYFYVSQATIYMPHFLMSNYIPEVKDIVSTLCTVLVTFIALHNAKKNATKPKDN